jgi:hypothetical protein
VDDRYAPSATHAAASLDDHCRCIVSAVCSFSIDQPPNAILPKDAAPFQTDNPLNLAPNTSLTSKQKVPTAWQIDSLRSRIDRLLQGFA